MGKLRNPVKLPHGCLALRRSLIQTKTPTRSSLSNCRRENILELLAGTGPRAERDARAVEAVIDEQV